MPVRRGSKDPAVAQSRSVAWKVALLFMAVGATWMIVTDLLVYNFVTDPVAIARLETTKGWTFVIVASALLYIVTDRAVRKVARARATIEAVIHSISDGVLVLGRDGEIRRANPAAVRMLGASGPEDLIGLDGGAFARRFHVARADGHLLDPEQFASIRALAGENPPPYKAVLHPPGKPDLVAVVTGAPVRTIPDGPVDLAVSIMHDVTALENLDRMRDDFVSSAAHTLKTPIAIINAQLHLLSNNSASSWKASADAVERQCGRMTRVIENLLVLARLRSETLLLEPEAVDFAGLIEDAIPEMSKASVDHALHTSVRAHPLVFADRERLQLIVKNLIELAYRRSEPRSDVALVLDEADTRGRLSLLYKPLVQNEIPFDESDAGFAGLGLERYVTSELVTACYGKLGSDPVVYLRKDWVEIPTAQGHLSHV